MNEALTPSAITHELGAARIAGHVVCLERVGSTMDVVRSHAISGANEGLLVLAEEQTAGRGRRGRHWAAPPGSALLLSLLLRPSIPPAHAFSLTMLAATALCEAIEDVTPLRPALKWPNDLLVGQLPCKAAGMLTELQVQGDQIVWAILGIGLNVSAHPPPHLTGYPSTNLAAALGSPVARLPLLRALLRRIDTGYEALLAGQHEAIFGRWRERLYTLGRPVLVETPAGPVAGIAEAVQPSGGLLVRRPDGSLATITAGDVAA